MDSGKGRYLISKKSEDSTKSVGICVGINVGINKTEKAVLEILIRNPKKTAEEMAIKIESTVF